MGRTARLHESGLMVAIADFAIAGNTLLLIIHYVKRLFFHNRSCTPPGPLAWPIIGHIHLLDANRPLHRTFYDLARRYGDIMLLKFGSRKIMVVSSWELASECLTTHDLNFASRPRSVAAEHLGYQCTMLGFDPYDRRCRKLRKIYTSQLLSPSMLDTSQHIRREEVSKSVRGLFTQIENEKAVVDVRSMAVELIFESMVRFILTDRSYLGSAEEVEGFKKIIKTIVSKLEAFNVGNCFPFLRWLDLQGIEGALKNLNKQRDDILQRVIEKHRLCMKKEKTASVIDVLMELVDKGEEFCSDDTTVKASMAILIMAGTDTSAATTEWAMASLLQHPEVLKRAQEELDVVVGRERVLEEPDLPNLKYLEAIVKETLRLYPAGPLLVPHMAKEACTVGGYCVPAGTHLFVNAWAIHRDPATWERPLEFEPERFMVSSSPDVDGHDFKYIPFGYGRRACPGMRLAMIMVKLTVGRLLQSFDWSIPDGVEGIDMMEGRGITLHKAVPLKAAMKSRLPHHLY